jgi:hypothetical protein
MMSPSSGVVLFPILLPWLPTSDLSVKGFILGGVVALPFAAAVFLGRPDAVWWSRVGGALTYLLALPPATTFIALNSAGATPFTSKSRVKREVFAYIPSMAWSFGIGIALTIALPLIRMLRG